MGKSKRSDRKRLHYLVTINIPQKEEMIIINYL